jgi:excisionase family DNA binding protein
MEAPKRFLNAKDLAQELGVTVSRIYQMERAGDLACVRLGRRILFPRRVLDELERVAAERQRSHMA